MEKAVGWCVNLLCVAVLVVLADGTGHFVNVALHKPCNISTNWDASRSINDAVNGDTGGSYDIGNNCIHTGRNDFNPLWEVNLGRPYPVYNITVWARDEPDETLRHRMQGCVILVDGVDCFNFTSIPATREIPITCSSGVLNGTVVRVRKNGPLEYYINICEFQVFSCSEDYWGSGCDRRCGQCTEGEVCDKVTGHCSSCSPGWRMPLCDQDCADGTYGPDCRETCAEGCGDVCDKVTGHCTCTPGWQGPTCDDECADGTYGPSCRETCAEGCGDVCNKVTGHCTCTPGWKGSTCGEECADGTYGSSCIKTCSEGCRDGCDKFTGHCVCASGWRGPTCDLVEQREQTAVSNMWPIVGSVIGVGVFHTLVIIIGLRWLKSRRSTSRDNQGAANNTGHSTAGTEAVLELKTVQKAAPNTYTKHPATKAENPYDCLDSSAAANNYESLEVCDNTEEQGGNRGLNCFCK